MAHVGAKVCSHGFSTNAILANEDIDEKIKADLIQRAQIKKNYAKLKRQGKIPDEPQKLPTPAFPEPEDEAKEPVAKPSNTPHPDRQDLIDITANSSNANEQPSSELEPRRKRKPKSTPFKREYEQAQQRKAEAKERRKAREEAERQRQMKIEERERFRRAMAKARSGGPNGQRKLGRESKVLLEKVKKMVGD